MRIYSTQIMITEKDIRDFLIKHIKQVNIGNQLAIRKSHNELVALWEGKLLKEIKAGRQFSSIGRVLLEIPHMRIDHNNFTKFDIAYLDHSHNLIISILFLFRRGHRNMKYLTTCYDLGLTQLDNNKIKGITLKDDIIALGNFYQDLLCTTKYFKLLIIFLFFSFD